MEEIALKDLCIKITDGAHHSPKEYPGGMPMASVKDMTDIGLDLSNCKTISKQDYDSLVKQNCQPQKGDVLLAKDGNTYLKYIFSCKETFEVVLLSSIAILRPNPEKVSSQFLAYYLSAPNIKGSMANCVSGSAIPRIILKEFRNFKVNLPILITQQKIATILSTYDDLLENNQKRIALLEKSARLLYEEWFVNLRFPGYEHTYIEEGVPEGWNYAKVDEICNVIQGFAFKGSDLLDDESSLITVRMGNFRPGGGLQFSDNTKYLPEGFGFKDKFRLQANDLVMVLSDVTRDGRIIANVGLIPDDNKTYVLNQRVAKIELEEELKLFMNFYFNSYCFKNYVLGCATSATVLNFSNKDLLPHKLIVPNKTLLLMFNESVSPLIKSISNYTTQNQKLKQARDILLPKLINGEIPV